MKKGNVYSVTVPRVLWEQVKEKMDIIGYTGVSELCRELLRRWVADDI